MNSLLLVLLVALVNLNVSSQSNPGHLKPFGSVGSLVNIEEIRGNYVDILKLFTYYLPRSEPIVCRRVLVNEESFDMWKTDEKLENEIRGLAKVNIYVDSLSNSQRIQMKFGEFLDRYQNEPLYFADNVPDIFRSHLTVPQPLQCPAVLPVFQSAVLMNGINSPPLMMNEEYDSLVCLFRGNKPFVLVNTNKYPDTRQIVMTDNQQAGRSHFNPDKVNFNQFPMLKDVDYHVTNLTAGDCIFIPVHWIFHERSFDSTIAVVYSIHHKQALNVDLNEIQTCSNSNKYDRSFTLDQVDFSSTGNEAPSLKDVIINLVKSNSNTYDKWLETLSRYLSFDMSSDVETAAIFDELYGILDHDGNGEIVMSEIDLIDGPHQHHLSDLLYEMFELVDRKQKNKSSKKSPAQKEIDEADEHLHLENYKTDL
ncbi:unnamed protein product [Adineta ricciae]|uniref:Cupin-like domain-containing protein n=1 Tax=Adineta ricciae TaxID=249248 RepID=A0A813TZ50_ADIRI|nr:unnamed protein product [Adineta ricciae]